MVAEAREHLDHLEQLRRFLETQLESEQRRVTRPSAYTGHVHDISGTCPREQRRVTRPSASAAALLARGGGLVDAVAQSQAELEQLDQLVARLK